ncbi:hypothetical protein NEOLEDRAFT_126879 [Neolentinus lepideus HHB14362 ss-1]|uniref:Uncharacterized protein n=1 Tax=Neolentinus lepideus HHB14362 ss-1 TaxID=1314782 RepID=A0A165MRF1_9AGAM|nr:hypothetical protein NEOLEDRAFT_126879 [Neolentinus lepideus HHB14362 ss-1]
MLANWSCAFRPGYLPCTTILAATAEFAADAVSPPTHGNHTHSPATVAFPTVSSHFVCTLHFPPPHFGSAPSKLGDVNASHENNSLGPLQLYRDTYRGIQEPRHDSN